MTFLLEQLLAEIPNRNLVLKGKLLHVREARILHFCWLALTMKHPLYNPNSILCIYPTALARKEPKPSCHAIIRPLLAQSTCISSSNLPCTFRVPEKLLLLSLFCSRLFKDGW
jgi:hypothetical protein